MNDVLTKLGRIRIIPVTVIEDERDAGPLAQALLEGGIATMEITFRSDAAERAMKQTTKLCPSMLLGAGTVRSVGQVKAALDGGARYIVSPGVNRSVVDYCLANGIAVIPGTLTPTEIGTAAELGLDVVKFFPAEAGGGVGYLQAVSAPYPDMKFIPTGGINESNFLSYLRLPSVLACGGSWMVKVDLISGRKFDEIKRLAARAVEMLPAIGPKP